MWPSNSRRQNCGPISCPAYSDSLAFPTAGSREIGPRFVGSKINVPIYSKLNEEGADSEEYARFTCHCLISSPAQLSMSCFFARCQHVFSLLLYIYLSMPLFLHYFISLRHRFSTCLFFFLSTSPFLYMSVPLSLYVSTSRIVSPAVSVYSGLSLLQTPLYSEATNVHRSGYGRLLRF